MENCEFIETFKNGADNGHKQESWLKRAGLFGIIVATYDMTFNVYRHYPGSKAKAVTEIIQAYNQDDEVPDIHS